MADEDISIADRAMNYLNSDEPSATPEPASPAAAATPAPVAGQPAAAAAAAPGPVAVPDFDPAVAAQAAQELQPVAADPNAVQPSPVIDPKNWAAAPPVQQFMAEHLGEYGKGLPQEQVGLVLQDAKLLYEIADGKQSPEKLLAYLQQANPKVLQDMATMAARMAGLKLEGATPEDPAMARVQALEERYAEQDRQREQARVQESRHKAFQGFQSEIKASLTGMNPWLASAEPAVQAGFNDLAALFVSSKINGSPEITARFEQGNFMDAKRLTTEFHNQLAEVLKSWTKALVASKAGQANANPKIPARGAPPQPAGTPKRDVSTYDGRMAAASEFMDSGT